MMTKFLGGLMVLCLAGFGFGQTAKVIALNPADAAKSRELHESAVKAQKAVDAFDVSVRAKYTNPNPNFVLSGWESGIEYSDDWKFIVPKTVGLTGSSFFTIGGAQCPNYVNPAVLTTPSWGTSNIGVASTPLNGPIATFN